MTRIKFLLVFSILGLAACATPEQQCRTAATRDLATVNALIAESEANIARGYTYERETRVSPRLTFCTGHHGRVGISFCSGNQIVERKKPVAIDLQEERRKLNSLRSKRNELVVVSRRAIAACNAG